MSSRSQKPLSRGRPRCSITAAARSGVTPRGRDPSGIRTGQLARPRRIVAEPPDLEAGSLYGQAAEVGSRIGAGVRDVLSRGEHPAAIRSDVAVQGELRPGERSTDESGMFTQGAIAV